MEVEFENLYAQLFDLVPSSSLELERLSSTLVNACYQHQNVKLNTNELLTAEHIRRLRELQKNKEDILSRPDRGTGIVLLNRTDYIDKMNTVSGDRSKSTKMTEKDKTAEIEEVFSKILRCLKQRGVIDASLFERIRSTGTVIPRLYGLPKVHKDGVPLRPILGMCNSPYHALAKWLAKLLESVRVGVEKHCVTDTFTFVDKIRDKLGRLNSALAGRQLFIHKRSYRRKD
ncbi:unnamed protein product [Echinostoma caproni]|uniref:Reverse transcriptase domain-containing protein n=1 Tax=Echinostoma caproni TaxID=27848 RepID=A0A183AAD0_9TREM|nr:unnamed protein product [Echinostoma caproni]